MKAWENKNSPRESVFGEEMEQSKIEPWGTLKLEELREENKLYKGAISKGGDTE